MKKIRKLRLKKDYSQEYMASRLGISQKAYSKIERGETALNHERLYQIAKILEVSPKKICPYAANCYDSKDKLKKLLKHLKEEGINPPEL